MILTGQQIIEKVTQGVMLAAKRLIEQRQKEDGHLIISKDGKVVKIKARELNTDELFKNKIPVGKF